MTILAFLTLLIYLAAIAEVSLGMRRLHRLDAADTVPAPRAWPSLSIVIPARDEEAGMATALPSVLALDYPSMEVVLVDDRSRDRTRAIAEALAHEDRRLRVLHVDELPDGWVGKSHALAMGVRATRGDLLLFTDADVVLARDVLKRAVALLEAERLDHLALAPRLIARSFTLASVLATFGLLFTLFARPWRVPLPGTREHAGVGAFNLVRRRTYEAIGTHARIARAPDDDLQLGKAIKVDGHRSALALAGGLVSVEWYPSVRALVDGLMKNAFAALGYSVPAVIGAIVAVCVIDVWPFVAVVATSGVTRAINVAIVVAAVVLCLQQARLYGSRVVHFAAFPLASLLFCWVLARAAWLALSTGAIEWRGRRYPLAELRSTRIR